MHRGQSVIFSVSVLSPNKLKLKYWSIPNNICIAQECFASGAPLLDFWEEAFLDFYFQGIGMFICPHNLTVRFVYTITIGQHNQTDQKVKIKYPLS